MKQTFEISVLDKWDNYQTRYVCATRNAIEKRVSHKGPYCDLYENKPLDFVDGEKVLSIKEFDEWYEIILTQRFDYPKHQTEIGYGCELISSKCVFVYDYSKMTPMLCFPKWEMDEDGIDHLVATIGKKKFSVRSRNTQKYPFVEYYLVAF